MPRPDPFERLPAVGAMMPAAVAAEVGEDAGPAVSNVPLDFLPWRRKLWAGTSHALGHLPPAAPGSGPGPLVGAGAVRPDHAPKGRGCGSPSTGCTSPSTSAAPTWCCSTSRPATRPRVRRASCTSTPPTGPARVRERGRWLPDLRRPAARRRGLALRCYTVNVRNDQDEALLEFLESDTFRGGLRLVGAAQPAMVPLSAMAVNLTKAVAGRSRNVPVQDFFLGLDFGANPMGARLAEGNYLALQLREDFTDAWDWSKWAYDPGAGQAVSTDAQRQPLPYNYIAFGVARCDAP